MSGRKSVCSGWLRWSWIGGIVAGALCSSVTVAGPEDQDQRKALKVCADPHSLPTSNEAEEGFENKIAQLFAKDLGLPLQYEWFPQRLGFIRNTLRNNNTPDGSYKCDLVIGVPEKFELAATTKPYFRSTWTMVYVRGRGLDDIKMPEDLIALSPERKKSLRIGLFDQSPAARWLLQHDLMEHIIPYPMMAGNARAYPGEIIEKDLVDDKINLSFVWGPIAGYFAKQIHQRSQRQAGGVEIVAIPMKSEAGIKFDFRIAMAVRFGEKAWREQINGLIDKERDAIRAILLDYGVPLLED